MILMLDNYDSFTYNLVQYLGELGADVEVRRNDQVTLQEIHDMQPERIMLFPAPARPLRLAFCWIPLLSLRASCPCLESALVIRRLVRHSVAKSFVQNRLCMAKPRPFITRGWVYFLA